ERVTSAVGSTRHIGHEAPGYALRHHVRRAFVLPVRVRLTPALEQVRRLHEPDALMIVSLEPRQVFQPLHHVVRVSQADLGGPTELLEAPRPRRVGEEHPDDARRPGREQGPQRTAGWAAVALAFLLDQHAIEREVAVAGEVDIPEAIRLQDSGALWA